MKTTLKVLSLILCVVTCRLEALCSYELLQSPSGQKVLLVGEGSSNERMGDLRTFIDFIESVNLYPKLMISIGLQKVDRASRLVHRTTPATEELEQFTRNSTSASLTYTWDVSWDAVRELLQYVKYELFDYTKMGVSNDEMRDYFKLPRESLSANTSVKRPWKEVYELYKSRRQSMREQFANNPWFFMKTHEFIQHLGVNLAYLESLAPEYQSDPVFSSVYEGMILKPYRQSYQSVLRVFKSIPKEDTFYEALMESFFTSETTEDILKFSLYWTKCFEEDTEFLFVTACLFNRLFKEGSKPVCFIAHEDVVKRLAFILKGGLHWTTSKESKLLLQITPFVIARNEDPQFDAGLVRVSHELIEPLLQAKCAACSKTESLKLCGGCKLVHYCSTKCQTDDRPTHKVLCKKVAIKQ